MRQLLTLSLVILLPGARQTFAQAAAMVTKEVVILQSTKDYHTALQTARQAAGRLQLPLDLEGYQPHTSKGLTLSRTACADNGFEYPAYVPRRYDGTFVSIEYSNGYEGFAKGYYLVVAAVGEPRSLAVRQASMAARCWYVDAYTKRTSVYMGCLH